MLSYTEWLIYQQLHLWLREGVNSVKARVNITREAQAEAEYTGKHYGGKLYITVKTDTDGNREVIFYDDYLRRSLKVPIPGYDPRYRDNMVALLRKAADMVERASPKPDH